MYEVVLCGYDDLPNEINKELLPNNGCGKEYATYILIKNNNEILGCYSDAIEPEDKTYYRDLNWIVDELERAYSLGTKV